MHELWRLLGETSPSAWPYLGWSGWIGTVERIAVPLVLWHRFMCHQPWCLRIPRHHADGAHYCRKHDRGYQPMS